MPAGLDYAALDDLNPSIGRWRRVMTLCKGEDGLRQQLVL